MNRSPEPVLILTAREREGLNQAISKALEYTVLFAVSPYDSEQERLALKKRTIHHQRILDVLYPKTTPICPVVPIESLAPDAGEAGAVPFKTEGYGPPDHFDSVKIKHEGLKISYNIDPRLLYADEWSEQP